VLLKDDRLSGFQGSRQSRYVEEFQHDDALHLESTPARVARRIAEHTVTALNQRPDQDLLIRKEASKKTRHLPLRRLFEQAPDALTALRPCWAMSPLDVAQTLPPRPLFDLVVFDEASQVMPCDAIPALLRGHRAMVAGDSRQLPPTSFFDSSGEDDDLDEGEESLADYESILDVMDSRLSRRPLNWHYRSQDERLIAYSNQEIYHGSLTTFPGADSDRCLNWVLVPHRVGVAIDRGSNSDEVLRVVDLMIEHAKKRPAESLGVIAMGLHHANRIEDALRQRIRQESRPELEEFFRDSHEERAFVKNLERVQGDERDAIILSIGYGKNADGRMRYNFGPLNNQGGERRLNVAITRARKRMTLVSSFEHADMDPERTRSTGANMLRGFLKFAESGGTELDGADEQTPLNSFELDIFDKLTAEGLDVVPQYGCSGYRIDFAVRHPTKPGQFAIAVEADGASYHSSPTARDRDRLRQEHLERLGWRFCRIWSTDWFNNHRREVDRVLAVFEQAIADLDERALTPTSSTAPSTDDPHDDEPHDRPPPNTCEGERTPTAPTLWPSDQLSEDESPDEPHSNAPVEPKNPPPLRSPKPNVPRYSSIDEYPHHLLVKICRWILSDGMLRTDAQLFEEVFNELPFSRRGSHIKKAINKAIADARRWER
jgi:very-short-patch-repair endonuclease